MGVIVRARCTLEEQKTVHFLKNDAQFLKEMFNSLSLIGALCYALN